MDTVWDQLKECFRKDKNNFKTLASKMLLGSIVITRYNNKTYRIDEIDFDKTVSDKFEMKDGRTVKRTIYPVKYIPVLETDLLSVTTELSAGAVLASDADNNIVLKPNNSVTIQ